MGTTARESDAHRVSLCDGVLSAGAEFTALPDIESLQQVVDTETPSVEVEQRIAAAALLAWSFTGGHGFSADRRRVHPALAGVIRDSVIRSLDNRALPLELVAPPFSAQPGSFADWSLAETAILEQLRAEARLLGSSDH